MNEQLCEELNNQLNKEFYSAYLYFAMSTYFSEIFLDGFAAFMKEQASEELEHAEKIHDYLLRTNNKITLSRIEAPENDWVNPIDVVEGALKHEKFVTSTFHRMYKLAKEQDDYKTEIFLQWFITEQIEEEDTLLKLLEQMKTLVKTDCGLQILDGKLKHSG